MPLSRETKDAISRAFGWAIVNRGVAFADIEAANSASNPAAAVRRLRGARRDLETLLAKLNAAEDLAAKDLRMDDENPSEAFLEALSFKPRLKAFRP
jgi:hypothetical protein